MLCYNCESFHINYQGSSVIYILHCDLRACIAPKHVGLLNQKRWCHSLALSGAAQYEASFWVRVVRPSEHDRVQLLQV